MSSHAAELPADCTRLVKSHLGSTCTAAVLRVEYRGELELQLAVGSPDPEDEGLATTADTPFDLASITKIFTSTAILRLVLLGEIGLDDHVQSILPNFRGLGKDAVLIRHLLTHTSGLPSLIRLWGPRAEEGLPRDAVENLQLVRMAGVAVEYSDPGFMLLGLVIEGVTGENLDGAVDALVLRPLGLRDVSYGPVPEAAATEYDMWRMRRLRGEVHDENAVVLGGVSGHAGLFGTARSVGALAREYVHDASPFLAPAIALAARTEAAITGDERRGLGWKLRSPAIDASERSFSVDSFGHYGFTGTAVWLDPQRSITVVLLTNRVYFGRDREGIRRLRRDIFDTVITRFPADAGDASRPRKSTVQR
jgi:CubicO group peptidase (beta-lactamase class C family)